VVVFVRRWAVGVLIYEMVAGYPPFYDEDRVTMFKNICHVKYSFPQHFSKVAHTAPAVDAANLSLKNVSLSKITRLCKSDGLGLATLT
jgi:serine/threonine protein kinase